MIVQSISQWPFGGSERKLIDANYGKERQALYALARRSTRLERVQALNAFNGILSALSRDCGFHPKPAGRAHDVINSSELWRLILVLFSTIILFDTHLPVPS